jgi:hypothetical protein
MFRDRKQFRLIKRSRLFDRAYYLLTYPDVRKADINPLMHFIEKGWKEGRNPSSTFNTQVYLEKHPDLLESGLNPLIHYIQHHQIEHQGFFTKLIKNIKYLWHYFQIKRSGLFDAKYYLETYPDVRRADIDPLMHFIKIGWKEGRNSSSLFSTKHYLELNPSFKNQNINPLIHYYKNQKLVETKLASNLSDHFGDDYYDLASEDARQKLIEFSSKFPPKNYRYYYLPDIRLGFSFPTPPTIGKSIRENGSSSFLS